MMQDRRGRYVDGEAASRLALQSVKRGLA